MTIWSQKSALIQPRTSPPKLRGTLPRFFGVLFFDPELVNVRKPEDDPEATVAIIGGSQPEFP